ncbi:MAG: adenylate/guanylate cyclase domain-containing protein, partial [Candidatus Mariimomonas ferrooxydans]
MTSRLVKAIVFGVLIGIAGLIVSPFHFMLEIEENIGLGLLFKLRGAKQAPSDAVIVSIDKESSEKLNLPDNPDKWPRSLHARLTETLMREGARVVAFDVHFIEPRSREDDLLFAEAMRKADNVVLTEPVKLKEVSLPGGSGSHALSHNIVKVVQPIDLFSRSALATAPFTLPRIPFKVGQYWTFETNAGDAPSMPIVALQLFAMEIYEEFIHLLEKASPDQTGKLPRSADSVMKTRGVKKLMKDIREIFVSEPKIAEKMMEELSTSETFSGNMKKKRLITSLIKMYGGAGTRFINYYGPPGTISTIPFYQALQLSEKAAGDKTRDLKGKAVFVGLSEVLRAERKDSFYTVFSRPNGTFISGVEIMATAFSNLLVDEPVKPNNVYFYYLIIILWGIFVGTMCRLSPIGVSALGVVGLSVLYLFAAEYQFKMSSHWYPIVIPLFFQAPLGFFSALVWNYIDTNKERQNIRKAFEHHLPKDVVIHLAKDIAHIKTGSRVVYGICLFTDAQQYCTFSETVDPKELGSCMNKYYETMFRPVKKHSGVVSGIMGDSMLALWVAARTETNMKDKACFAALDIKKDLKLFDQSTDAVKLKTRIGLHYGQILLGHIGALDHYQYTPMGDIVNTASRIEGLNKHLGTSVLVSEEVIHELNGFQTRELGKFRLKGKVKPIVVHELLSRIEETDEKQRSMCENFAEALDAFRKQSWDRAIEKFNQSIKALGEDGPSLFYAG